MGNVLVSSGVDRGLSSGLYHLIKCNLFLLWFS